MTNQLTNKLSQLEPAYYTEAERAQMYELYYSQLLCACCKFTHKDQLVSLVSYLKKWKNENEGLIQ